MLVSQVLALKDEPQRAAVLGVAPQAAVLEAIRLMAEHHVGALLVLEGEALVGIVSERDYARKVVLKGRSSKETTVAEIMSTPVVTVAPASSLEDCMRIVTERRIRHLPVVERERVIGVVSIGDLVKNLLAEKQKTIEQLEAYIRS